MDDTQDTEWRALLARLHEARQAAQDTWMRRRGVLAAGRAVSAARPQGQAMPDWARSALTAAEAQADKEHDDAMDAEVRATRALSTYINHLRIAEERNTGQAAL